MKNQQTRSLIVAAILLAVFHVIAFVIPFSQTATFWVCYIFGSLSILGQIPMVAVAFKNGSDAKSQFYGFPILRVALLYLVAQLILSLVGMIVAAWVPAWIAVIVFVVLLAAALVGLIATDATRDELGRQDMKIKTDVSHMRALQSLSTSLVSQTDDPDVRKEVERLAEALRYSDPVSSAALADVEKELANCMDELQRAILENDKSGSIGICKKAVAVLAERNRLCKLNK